MKKILLVDDEFAILETLVDILSYEGYEVIPARNGEQGLLALAQAEVSLVLLDFMMPLMSGLQMLARLRSDPRYQQLPVILMTAAPGSLPKGDNSWNALLRKPFDVDLLLATVRRVLGEEPGP